jgi:hypothetical protein
MKAIKIPKRSGKDYLKLIDETIEYYRSGENRGLDEEGYTCVYHDTSTNNKCAVGRCLDLEKTPKSIIFDNTLVSSCYKKLVFKEEYQGYNINFWKDLQSFHDNNGNWSINDYSAIGNERIKALKKTYGESQ